MNIKSFLKKSWNDGTEIGIHNIWSTALIGSGAHFGFYFIFKYVFHIYENFLLRMIAVLLCILVVPFYKKRVPWFYCYWHFMLIYVLPFIFTVNLLKSNFNELWIYWEIFMIFILIMHVPNWFMCVTDLLIGVSFAILYYVLSSAASSSLEISFNVALYSIVIVFSVIAGILFNYANRMTSLNKLKEQHLQLTSMAGSIVHEIRNPLNAINLVDHQIKDLTEEMDGDLKKRLLDLSAATQNSVKQANEIINVILADLGEKPISSSDFCYLNVKESITDIVEKYGYNEEEKERVKLHIDEESNFIFKAVPERFTFIIYNLLKNALYYLKEYPDSIITIGTETREIDGVQYNAIYVHDTGPGIAPHVLPKLFGDFYTSGKKGGTGLGLAFCKRNMKLFGGDITCESEFGKWTRFSLLFPVLSEAELETAKIESRRRKILLVDDQEVNLITLKSKIERILPDISCDLARAGKEAINMAKENKYHLILMDVQMPEMDGIEAVKRIRSYDKEVPIIALTSLSKEYLLEEVNFVISKENFNYYLNKLSTDNILYRAVTKWIIDLEDDMHYMGTKEEYLEVLKGKKAILADDEKINRMMTKRMLEGAGMIIAEANNGKELLELYQNSLDKNGKSSFDIIITDINMPPYNGDKATKEIRRIEAINKISHHDEMPIIALSGDGRREDIHHFFECQMTDYFIKGSKPELLPKIVANYLVKRHAELDTKEANKPEEQIEDQIRNKIKNEIESQGSKIANDNSRISQIQSKNLNQNRIEHFNKEDQRMLLKVFIKSSGENMVKIIQSKNSGDVKSLLFYIHSIKGTASSIGAEKLSKYIKDIESKIRDGNEPHGWMEELHEIYGELENEIGEVLKRLRS
ncbi:MAG: integral rane sensor hybrid histidine kinase [Rickettsiaceae bacterium]|jgi:CheY-like chemotaxis protein|nr:integral rane sensor hybrid histidine kinase [Rickettsiaceae bacterium]